ncbi:hypothetical protein GCM10010315_34220 [Streptomyces luteosporeus]|uniref:Histidine kinase/HSP90-like ATPase domain-containing protein n=2 Tax=Streptomyces TaxID=1883 RepID=A0ABP6GBG8_9ACTN
MVVSFRVEARHGSAPLPERDALCVSRMRRLTKARLRYCGLPWLADDVELLVSELVTNAITHSHGTEITMSLLLANGTLRLEVRDQSTRHPQIQNPDDDEESGRGLKLVEWITKDHYGSWGVSPDGTSTWCTLTTASDGRSR